MNPFSFKAQMLAPGERCYWHDPNSLLWQSLCVVSTTETHIEATLDDSGTNPVKIEKKWWYRIRKHDALFIAPPLIATLSAHDETATLLNTSRPSRRCRHQVAASSEQSATLETSIFVPGEIVHAMDKRCDWYK